VGVDENERPACDWKGKTMEGVPVLLSSIDRRRAAWARYMENYERIAEQDIASRAAGTRGVLPGGPGRTGSRDTIGPACLHMPPCGSGKGRMIYAFEDFELDTDLHELRRGGERVELQPRVLRLLLHLLRQRQRVVPRDELFEEVWEGVAVSDHALFHALQKLRSALGESGERQRIIRTVPRVGYRFAVAVDERAGSSAAPEPSGTPPARGDAPHPGPVLIGREPELAALRSALTEALAGSGRVVLIEGPAGIGKSRLAEEAAAFSAGRGAGVQRASAYQGTGAPPFWLWAQVLRTVADTWSEDVLRRTMGEGASAIARLAPALEAKLGVTPPAVRM